MRLNENDHIYIFMNISRNVKNRENMREKTIDIAKVKMGYKICLASLKQILMAASVAVQLPQCHKILSTTLNTFA